MGSRLTLVAATPAVSKNPSVEVVLARYDEDTSWATQYKDRANISIYNKGPIPHPDAKEQLPNVGRESHTYLHHIIENYHTLADWTVFSQATAPSVGHLMSGKNKGGHMLNGVDFDDYLQPREDSYFVFSCASAFPECYQTDRRSLQTQYTVGMVFKDDGSECPATSAGWIDWWYHPKHAHVTRLYQKNALSPLEFYSKFIAERPLPHKAATFVFSCGARFALSRQTIHSRPMEYYQQIRSQLETKNPIEGFYMEVFWYDVFHPQNLQMDAPRCDLPEIADRATIMRNYAKRQVQIHTRRYLPYILLAVAIGALLFWRRQSGKASRLELYLRKNVTVSILAVNKALVNSRRANSKC